MGKPASLLNIFERTLFRILLFDLTASSLLYTYHSCTYRYLVNVSIDSRKWMDLLFNSILLTHIIIQQSCLKIQHSWLSKFVNLYFNLDTSFVTLWAWTFTLRLNRRSCLLPYKLNLRLFFLLSKIRLFRRICLILTFKSSGPL